MDELKKTYRVVVFIGMAMIMNLFIYAALVELLKANLKPFRGFSPTSDIEILKYLFFAIAVTEFFLIRFIRNRILSVKGTLSSRISKLLSVTIVTYAISESNAIFGLVLFLIGGSSLDFYTFMVISLFFYAIYFPRYNQWEEWMQAVKSPHPPFTKGG
jgi:F0F1-type ATP synthase membrane subunit c/vacuolar-type H+-ATPase subunit K